MKARCALLSILCLSLAIACQSPPPPLRSTAPAMGISLSTAQVPTESPTDTPILRPSPTVVTTPPTITPTPFTHVIDLASRPTPSNAWTYWPGVDQSPGVQAVTTNGDVIWASTAHGLYRIDPRTGAFTGYGEVSLSKQLLPVADGTLWATGQNGTFFFDGQAWHHLTEVRADSLAIDVNGDLWLMQYNNRFGGTTALRFVGHTPPADQSWSFEYYPPQLEPPWLSWDTTDCAAWVVSLSHRTLAECQALQAARSADFLPGSTLPYLTAIDRTGSAWWITASTLHHHPANPPSDQKLPAAHLESTITSQELPVSRITSITPDPEHGVWLGTDRGLLYSDGVTLRLVPLEQNLPTLRAQPRNIAVDTQGTAWIVTAQGVQLLPVSGTQWQDVTDFNLGPGVKHWPLGTIAAAQEGGIWATHGGDIWRFGGATTAPLTNSMPLGEFCQLTHLTVDRDGNVWSPLGRCGVTVFLPRTGEWIQYPFDDLGVAEVISGGDGAVYVRDNSSHLYRHTNFDRSGEALAHAWDIVDSTQSVQQASLGADAQGGLWTVNCPTGEVWRTQASHITTFGKIFAPAAFCLPTYRWYFDTRSWLWVYDGADLHRYDGQAWHTARQPDVGDIQDMTTGPDGRVWIVGDHGVAVYEPAIDELP